ncbi:MAG: glycosyltransferase [Romboutsia sp.]
MNNGKIPKIIHYCWFGGKDKPSKVKECISSWNKVLSDYEFMEWNENNFDINCNKYVKQAYESGKFAYVSDYARINALYEYGGIYMDTDVEVYKSFNDLLSDNKCILGFEQDKYIATSFIAVVQGYILIKEFLEQYKNISFYNEDMSLDLTTNVQKLTSILERKGLKRDGKFQMVDGISIYPQEYFSPYDYGNCIKGNTENTYCEHLFLVSWLPRSIKLKKVVKKIIVKLFGKEFLCKLRILIKSNKKA